MKDFQAGKNPKVKYYLNDSNGLLKKSVTSSVVTQITNQLNAPLTTVRLTQANAQQLAPNIAQQAAANGNSNPQLIQAQVQKSATAAAKKSTVSVDAQVSHLNKMKFNYQYQMAPMFINLGTYLGIMIMSIVISLIFTSARFTIGKVSAFVSAQLNGLLASIILPLFSVTVLKCIINFSFSTYSQLLGTQILFSLSVFEFTFALALLMVSLPSMLLQLPLLVSQTIAGGAIVPRETMNSFYLFISKNTPMYQGVYSTFNSLYDGNNNGQFISSMIWIILLSLIVGMLSVWIGYRGKTRNVLSKLIPFA